MFQNKIFNILIEDSCDADVYSYFKNAVEFIGERALRMKFVPLIYPSDWSLFIYNVMHNFF